MVLQGDYERPVLACLICAPLASRGRVGETPTSMSALPPKADIGTGPRITFGAPAPEAWRYSPRSARLIFAE